MGSTSTTFLIEHSVGFASVSELAGWDGIRALDLGSGGGIPGLVLAAWFDEAAFVLVDSNGKRARFVRDLVDDLEWSRRVTVVGARAEDAGRVGDLRGSSGLVVSRGFGPPAVTAECAAPFLGVGGTLLVSEPPGRGDGDVDALSSDDDHPPDGLTGVPVPGKSSDRWPSKPLAELGLVPRRCWRTPYAYQELRQEIICPEKYPRRTGVPSKRPLFGSK
ncbi:MAG TPA: RsmG family class I SAM-dependent methyltransferase [Acidimicrobiales bacterium]|nr:RsmG family class I SAM-dependent methyltransferase [Acidimicrobiales bacterium]